MTYHLGADYFEDPDGTFVSKPEKYIDKLADTYKRLFNEDPPKGYKTPLDKNDHPELDTSEIPEGDMAVKYLTMVGQLQWLVTLGSNRNMSKSKGWTLQSSLLTLWMDET